MKLFEPVRVVLFSAFPAFWILLVLTFSDSLPAKENLNKENLNKGNFSQENLKQWNLNQVNLEQKNPNQLNLNQRSLNQSRLVFSPDQPAKSSLRPQWRAGLEGKYFEDHFNRDTLSVFLVDLKGGFEVTDRLLVSSEVSALFEQGTSQGLEDRTSRRDSGFYLNDARLSYLPSRLFRLDAGALSQKDYMSSLITNSQAFPATRETIDLTLSTWRFHFSLQQAIPTSHKLSSKSVEKEALPLYMTQQLLVEKTFSQGQKLSFAPGFYQFYALPSAVAKDSCLLGNSTTTCRDDAEFVYNFSGLDLALSTSLPVRNGWKLKGSANYLKNFEADDGRSEGMAYSAGITKDFLSQGLLALDVEYFEKQADVVPAFYSPWLLENNRKGTQFTAAWTFPSQVTLRTSYARTQPLISTPYQDDINFVNLSLETQYASF